MTTGATSQLGLALPVQGELSGTWGDTVNNGITQYTNIAIAGTLTLTGDGAVTLANTTGDSSASNITSSLSGAGTVTAQFAIVKVSGTTTTKVVTGPSYSKTYVVDNASSYAVTFKASGQTGVSIAASEKVTVVFNGTDYIKIAGTIANAAGSNTQIQFNSSGLFGASANLTWDGSTLSTTGLTASSTVTLSGGTANGVAYLNGSKVVTSGSALTFDGTNFAIGSMSNTGGGRVEALSNATSAYTARSSSTTGANGGTTAVSLRTVDSSASYWANAAYDAWEHVFRISGSTEQMRLTSTGLGIGTSSPAYKLDVNGGSANNIINATGSSANTTAITVTNSNSATYFTLSANGATGYGVSNWANSTVLESVPASTGGLVLSSYSNSIYFQTNARTTRATIDSSGNLGLGVTPSAWGTGTKGFDIGSGSAIWNPGSGNQTHILTNAYTNNTDYIYKNSSTASRYAMVGNSHQWFTAPSGTAGNAISFTQAMTLDASGNLGIGTSSPSTYVSNRGLAIVGFFGTSSKAMTIYNDSGASASNVARIDFKLNNTFSNSSTSAAIYGMNPNASANNGGALVFATSSDGTNTDPTERARIDSSGNLLVGNTGTAGGRIDVTANSGGTGLNIRARSGNDFGFIQFKSNDGATTWGDVYATSAIRLYCDAGGTNGVYLTNGATSWTANSDERLKENLVPIENGLSKVCSLRSVIGNFISDETKTKKPFLIAQDVLAVLPEAVSSGAIPKSEDTAEYLGVAYTEVIPLLVAAIKEQQAIIESLKARLDAANL